MNWIGNLRAFGSAIASSSAEEPKAKEPKAKKQRIDKKYSDSRSILVRAFSRRGDEFHVAEAEIKLDSDGAFAVDYVAAKLLLKGTLYVSDIPRGGQQDTFTQSGTNRQPPKPPIFEEEPEVDSDLESLYDPEGD
jgi:hypothetical protein